MNKAHKHNYVAKRPDATVLVCSCGRFQHVITKETIIFVEKNGIRTYEYEEKEKEQ